MTIESKTQTIVDVCAALAAGDRQHAIDLLQERYPFAPAAVLSHKASKVQSTRVFLRDGFIDRYTGDRLIFPPALRLLAIDLPTEFPWHTNWKPTSRIVRSGSLGQPWIT
jgi:hypothetical protein